jgi:hypothetical protein
MDDEIDFTTVCALLNGLEGANVFQISHLYGDQERKVL